MTTVLERMVNTQLLLFIYALCGVLMRRIGILATKHRESYINLLINIALPCMILSSFNNVFDPEQVRGAWWMLVVSAGMLVVAAGVSWLLWRRRPDRRRSVLTFATMFSNAGNAGLPVVQLVYGELGVFYASLFLIPLRLAMWTVGVGLYVRDSHQRVNWLALLANPSVSVVFAGLALMLFQVTLPQVIGDAVRNIGAMTTPLAMMIIGATLADMKPREVLSADAFAVSAVRLLAMPLLTLLGCRLLGLDWLMTSVAVTLLAMPVATNAAILGERYGADYQFASKCVFISTLLSMLTVPLITWIIEMIWV